MLEILNDLWLMGLCVVANIVLGTFNSINVFNLNFDWKLLVNGIVKGLIVCLSFLALAYVAFELPELTEELGINPRLMLISGIGIYATKVAFHLSEILGLKKKENFVKFDLETKDSE